MDKVNNGHSNWLHPARRSGSREKGVCPPGTTVHTELYGPIVLGLGNSSCSRFQCHSHTVLFMSNIFGGYADRGRKKNNARGDVVVFVPKNVHQHVAVNPFPCALFLALSLSWPFTSPVCVSRIIDHLAHTWNRRMLFFFSFNSF